MIKRLEWALNHRHWTIDDWSQILWSDEIWVTDGRHRDAYITRKVRNACHQLGFRWLIIYSLVTSLNTPASSTRLERAQPGCSGGVFTELRKGPAYSGKKLGFNNRAELL